MHLILSTFFYLTYMVIMFLTLNRRFRKKNKKNTIYFIVIISLFFLLKKLGLDYEMYVELYNELDIARTYNFKIEFIPYLFMYIPKQYNLPPNLFFFIIGTITVVLNYKVFKNYNNLLLSLFFLFFLFFFRGFSDAMRQLLAASFILYGIYSIQIEEKTFKSGVLFILALLSHYSSIIIIPVYFLIKLLVRIKIQVNLQIYILAIVFIIMISQIINFIIQGLSGIPHGTFENPYIDMIVFKLVYYLVYYQQEGYTYENSLHKVLWYLLMFLPEIGSIMLTSYLIKIKAYYGMDRFLRYLLLLSILGNLIFIMFSSIGLFTMAARISLTLTLGSYLLLSYISLEIKNRKFYNFILLYYLFCNIIILIYNIQPFNPTSPAYIL